MKVFSLYDPISREWAPVFFQRTLAAARRSFDQLVKENPAASDLVLYHIGYWYPEAEVMPLEGCPRLIVDDSALFAEAQEVSVEK